MAISPIETKSTGMLFDELITTDLKREHFGDYRFADRMADLTVVLASRLKGRLNDQELQKLVNDLKEINRKCWDAQEAVMQFAKLKDTKGYNIRRSEWHDCAYAAIEAQMYNAQRNQAIRAIDEYVGDSNITPTEKSYA